MARGTPCVLILNTKNGHCLQPQNCNSISQALRIARETELAYRIFVKGKCVRHGWFVK